jgi:hypothetical protein
MDEEGTANRKKKGFIRKLKAGKLSGVPDATFFIFIIPFGLVTAFGFWM